MVIVVKIDNSVLDICKSYGIKNYSKLTKKRITDKNGHSRFVWVKINNDEKIITISSDNYKRLLIYTSDNSKSVAELLDKHIKKLNNCKFNDIKSYKIINYIFALKRQNRTFKGFSLLESNNEEPHLECKYLGNRLVGSEIFISESLNSYDYDSFVHEVTHAIDSYITKELKTFTEYYNDQLLEEFKGCQLPDFLEEKNISYMNQKKDLENKLHYFKSEISYQELLDRIEEYNAVINSYNNLVNENEDFYYNKGYQLVNDIFNAINKNKLVRDGKVEKIRDDNYYENHPVIQEVIAQYITISLYHPELKKLFDNQMPGFNHFMKNLINEMYISIRGIFHGV